MKTFAITLTFLLFLAIFNLAKSQPQLTTTRGITYKILKKNDGKKIELNNIVTINLIEKTEKDSVLFSSYNLKSVLQLQIHPSEEITDLMDILLVLSEKDSVIISIPTDSIFKNNEGIRPKHLPTGSNLIFVVKIERVQTTEEILAEEKKHFEEEKLLLSKYITQHNLKPLFTSSGLLYIGTKKIRTFRPEPNDTVLFNYTASTLDGKVFDTSIETEAIKAGIKRSDHKYGPIRFIIGRENILTPWDEGLLLMNEGSTATLILTSNLAYGAVGYQNSIKPYSTLLIDVALIKIFKANADYVPNTEKTKAGVRVNYENSFKPLISGLTSLFVLLNSEKKKNTYPFKPYSINPATPWSMRWLEVINTRLGN